ncbi:MAG: STAS domain-containing protein [Christensenellales bacterium]
MVVNCRRNGNVAIIALSGELDHHSAAYVKNEMSRILLDPAVTDITLDLKNLRFMDSSGIGVIMGRYRELKKRNGRICAINISPQVDKLMSLSGLYKIVQKIG